MVFKPRICSPNYISRNELYESGHERGKTETETKRERERDPVGFIARAAGWSFIIRPRARIQAKKRVRSIPRADPKCPSNNSRSRRRDQPESHLRGSRLHERRAIEMEARDTGNSGMRWAGGGGGIAKGGRVEAANSKRRGVRCVTR